MEILNTLKSVSCGLKILIDVINFYEVGLGACLH